MFIFSFVLLPNVLIRKAILFVYIKCHLVSPLVPYLFIKHLYYMKLELNSMDYLRNSSSYRKLAHEIECSAH
jgi:hypothetical protein